MNKLGHTEDNLVEKPAIESLKSIGYEYKTLGQAFEENEFEQSDATGIILEETFKKSIKKINKEKNLSEKDIRKAYQEVKNLTSSVKDIKDAIKNNKEFNKYIREGVKIENDEGKVVVVRLLNLENIEDNDFKMINQFVINNLHDESHSRPDLLAFINGLPMIIFEFKNPTDQTATLLSALDGNIARYKKKIPNIFVYNQLIVLSDKITAKYGTLTSTSEYFTSWKGIESENEESKGDELDILIKGMFDKKRLLDIIRYYTFYEERNNLSNKIICRYHQYYSVNRTIENIKKIINDSSKDSIGTLWHTQGSGKTVSLAFLVIKCREILDSPAFIFITDRKDLDNQITEQFERVGIGRVHNAENIEDLRDKIKTAGNRIISTTIQKFKDVDGTLNNSSNIIVIADEAHRSQYRSLAAKMRGALPNASFMGVTGTPISFLEKDTNLTFGENISEYTMFQAQEDGVVVPIYYEFAAPSLKLEKLPQDLLDDGSFLESEEMNDEQEYKDVTLNDILNSKERLEKIAEHVVEKLNTTPENQKAMFVANSRQTALNMYTMIKGRMEGKDKEKVELVLSNYEGLDREYDGEKDTRELAIEFKKDDSRVRIVVVCDMWLTGFDVPSLFTLFLDKRIKGHNLMQAVARVNRVFKGKDSGLIIDYIGIISQLNEAIKRYAKRSVKAEIVELEIAIDKMNSLLGELILNIGGIDLDGIKNKDVETQRNIFFRAFENAITNERTGNVSDKKKREFVNNFTILERLHLLIMPRKEAYSIADKIDFLKGVSIAIRKLMSVTIIIDPKEQKIKDVNQYISVTGIDKVFTTDDSMVNVFDNKLISDIANEGFKNVAIEILNKLLRNEINIKFRKNRIEREELIERIERLLKEYKEGIISTKDVLEKIKEHATEVKMERSKDNDLTDEEEIFFSALKKAHPKTINIKRGDDQTKKIIREIISAIRNDIGSFRGWYNNDQIKARIKDNTKKNIK